MFLRKEEVPFSMPIGHGELMHECFPKHSRMGTAGMKRDDETDEDTQKRGVSMENSTAGTNKRSPDGLSNPNQNTIIKQNMVIFYKKWKKYNEIQLTKKQNGVIYSKNDKSSTLPRPYLVRLVID